MNNICTKAFACLCFILFGLLFAYPLPPLNQPDVDVLPSECVGGQEQFLSCERTLPNGEKQRGSGACRCRNGMWSGGCTLPEITYTEIGLKGSRTCTMPREIRGCGMFSDIAADPVCGEWSGDDDELEEIADRCTLGELQFRPDPNDECATQTRECCNPKASLFDSPWSEWGEDCNLNDCSGSFKPRFCYVENGSCTIKDCNCVSGEWECTKDITCNSGYILNAGECKSISILPPAPCTHCSSNADCAPCGLVCVNLSTNPGTFVGYCQRGFNGNI